MTDPLYQMYRQMFANLRDDGITLLALLGFDAGLEQLVMRKRLIEFGKHILGQTGIAN
jgi:hypothetical protein